jgi:hypothetical protein
MSKPPPSVHNGRGGGVQWQDIERFDSGAMQKLVDKAYGITDAHRVAEQLPLHHGTRIAQRNFIHNHVYLPSVYRTLDYLDRARESPRDPVAQREQNSAMTRPAPIGTKLLSTQLHALQAELLQHYESDKKCSIPSSTLWSPHPPRRTPSPPLSCSTESALSSSSQRTGSFQSLRRAHVRPSRRQVPKEEDEREAKEEEDNESVLVLTDSDTYSLSSGVDTDSSEREPSTLSTPPMEPSASLKSDTASWASLTSYVVLALEGSKESLVNPPAQPLVSCYDSDDVRELFTDTSDEPSEADPSEMMAHTDLQAVQPRGRDKRDGFKDRDDETDGEADHVVFVDNGVRVDAAGRVLAVESEPADAWTVSRTPSPDELQQEPPSVSCEPSEEGDENPHPESDSSGADSEMTEPSAVPSSLSSDTPSWTSLESHVLLALEVAEAMPLGSQEEPTLAPVYGSDDVRALFTDTSGGEASDGGSSGSESTMLHGDSNGAEDGGFARDDGDEQREDSDVSKAYTASIRDENELDSVETESHERSETEDVAAEEEEEEDEGDARENRENTSQDSQDEAFENEPSEQGVSSRASSPSADRSGYPDRDAREKGDTTSQDSQDEAFEVKPSEQGVSSRASSPSAEGSDYPMDSEASETASSCGGTEREASPPVENGFRRYSHSSAATYDDADFEDADEHDADSTDGYESFEDDAP